MAFSFSTALDVMIALFFVFMLIGLICSQLNDKIAAALRMRAKGLEEGLQKFITGDSDLKKNIYANALIQTLVPEEGLVTQWLDKTSGLKNLLRSNEKLLGIPKQTFALALFNILIPNPNSGKTTVGALKTAVAGMHADLHIRAPLLSILSTANDNIDTARQNLESWYETTMKKTTEIYQGHMWRMAFLIGLAVAVFLNVDAIAVGTRLWSDSSLRSSLVAEANKYAQGTPEKEKALAQLNALNLPIGWNVQTAPGAKDFLSKQQTLSVIPGDWTPTPGQASRAIGFWDYVWKVIGMLVIAVAGAQGAPFWFDLLRKVTKPV